MNPLFETTNAEFFKQKMCINVIIIIYFQNLKGNKTWGKILIGC